MVTHKVRARKNKVASRKNKVASRKNKVGPCFYKVPPCFFSAGCRIISYRSVFFHAGNLMPQLPAKWLLNHVGLQSQGKGVAARRGEWAVSGILQRQGLFCGQVITVAENGGWRVAGDDWR